MIDTGEALPGFLEEAWIGNRLEIGDEVKLAVTDPMQRCVMTTRPQGELPNDRRVLRTIFQYNSGNAGVCASVVATGGIARGDPVQLRSWQEDP